MTDRRALALSAACITAGILVFLIATFPNWRAAIGMGTPWSTSATPDPVMARADKAGLPETGVSVAGLPNSISPPVPAPSPAAPAAPVPDPVPSFDVVRVEPTGESVIAARAKPGAEIVLLDGGHPIAKAKADSSGQVALLPPTLEPGEHSLMLSVGEPNSPNALSSQSVAVSVSGQPRTAPMVALTQPDQPTRVLSEPVSTSVPSVDKANAPAAQPSALPVAISSIEVEDLGSFYATGKAAPGSHCRVYLNGSFVATVTAGGDGVWSLKIKRGMKPGHYVVRADQVDAGAGRVQARAEVPFDYPARAGRAMSLLRPKPAGMAAAKAPGSAAQPQGGSPGAPAAQTMQSKAASSPAATAGLSVPGGTQPEPAAPTAAPPASQAGAGSAALTASAESSAPVASSLASTVIAQLLTTKVIHGDSLWRISRKILGHGERYTQIYAANTTQIRDPRLIYPGQIFVMPQATP